MPELPDLTVYLGALDRHAGGQVLRGLRILHPFVLRSVEPAPAELVGKRLVGTRRLGKRVVLAFDDELFVVIHLMIAGRFRWKSEPGAAPPGRIGLAAFDFDGGTLLLTEAGKKKRASLHVVDGDAALADHDRGGLEPLGATRADFATVLVRENHTVKRALTDPRLFAGIGNAYSDEILHRARLSPVKWTTRLDDDEIDRLHAATQSVLTEWIERLTADVGDGFPSQVTAFRPEMAVHGRFGEACPVCSTPVQRIVHASNESNYCPSCQTGGKLLADRALSRLLREDWPRSIEELEERRTQQRARDA